MNILLSVVTAMDSKTATRLREVLFAPAALRRPGEILRCDASFANEASLE
jgi:hypothetical protein